jgi:hypothetical protein
LAVLVAGSTRVPHAVLRSAIAATTNAEPAALLRLGSPAVAMAGPPSGSTPTTLT